MSEEQPVVEGRGVGRALTLLGGSAGAASGLTTLGTVVSSALDGSGSSSPTAGFVVALVLLVLAVVLSALGARRLGVRSVLARAAYAGLVASTGYVAVWVAAILAARLSS